MRHPRYRAPRRSRQRGVTLVIVLIMLVLIMLVGVYSLRGATVDERMAGHTRDRDKAFQAAEAAVRSCLADLVAGSYGGVTLTPSAATATPVWDVTGNWTGGNSTAVTLDTSAGLSAYPRCLVEELGTGSGNYRVTGRAVGGSAQTVVMLQATYAIE